MGALLNSKSEFNRSYIPRLTVAEEEVAIEMEQAERDAAMMVGEELRSRDSSWEKGKVAARPRKSNWSLGGGKHSSTVPPREQRPSKRRKYSLLTNWGEEETGLLEETTGANTDDDHNRIVVRDEDDKHISRDSQNGGGDKFVDTDETSTDDRCNETRINITDERSSKCDDDDQRGDASSSKCGDDDDQRGEDEGGGGDKCVIEGTECTTHGCLVKTFKLTSKKWTWKDRQKKFGYVSVKRNVKICPLRNSGRVIPKNVPEQNFSTVPGDQNCVETNLGAN